MVGRTVRLAMDQPAIERATALSRFAVLQAGKVTIANDTNIVQDSLANADGLNSEGSS